MRNQAELNISYLYKLLDMARFHLEAGRRDEAEQVCQKVIRFDPGNKEARYILAHISAAREDFAAAADAMMELCNEMPRETLYPDLVTFHVKADRLDALASFFRKQATDDPRDFSAWFYLGRTCLDLRDKLSAGQALVRATRLKPDDAQTLYQLAMYHKGNCHMSAAERLLRKAVEFDSRSHHYSNYLAGVLKKLGRADEAVDWYLQALALSDQDEAYYSNYLMNFLCTTSHTPEQVCREHLRWAEKCCRAAGEPWCQFENEPNPERRLRIGYVSSDFYSHPVAFFIEPLLTLHDQYEVDVYIFSNVEKEDYITEQFRQRPCTWRQVRGVNNMDVCRMIREDRIDILVDLGGHTRSNRLPIFAKKPAPVQVTWLGYANTTGLPTMDYRITDAVADPPGMTESQHSEQLYRLPGSFICYHPPLDSSELSPLPLLERGAITFVAYNNFAKLNSPLLDLWCRVLRMLPDSRLALKDRALANDPEFRLEMLDLFAQRGITAERLIIRDRTETVHAHLEALAEGDIALDSHPYSGTTTTCESLWMGVPVITLAGRTHASRVSASLLTSVGVPELIAENDDDYVTIAVALARDMERLQHYRRNLREMMLNSSLMDLQGFARKMENAYRQMWRKWCQQFRC
jgi:predicted O-linked N-acetylglucosamine transferase (SPINDLY family)